MQSFYNSKKYTKMFLGGSKDWVPNEFSLKINGKSKTKRKLGDKTKRKTEFYYSKNCD